jgi:ribosomal protein S18 acetylase RimI-like enzyme
MMRPLTAANVNAVVDIHMLCFPDSEATKLGRRFLEGYYAGYCGSSRAVAFTCTVDDRIVGFIVGGVNIQALSREIVGRSKAAFVRSAVGNLARNPLRSARKLYEYARTYLLPKKHTFYADDTAGLVSVAVLQDFRRRGIAEKLTCAFLEEIKRRDIRACRVGVNADNLSARRLYERLGFKQVNEEGSSYILTLRDPR